MAGKGNNGGNDGGNSSIDVTVNYQAERKSHSFPRGAKVADVLTWAIEAFKIDDAVATEVELVVEGTTDELAGSKPLASLAHGDADLTLDLVRGELANGSS
ncbi:hypothetical protein KRR38_31505 [Novosphingobium sp. G106]|uniref:hypothetical protein n=1 Tax=Novosphingobium sp. G106 TaxID=2849500 RepID=UPI001C2CE819|nr:hypothetical protein [Novosphingobium sp. G106]MBV1692076.1 hypothetical protein [Novosphingobium sp. G106]